MGDVIKVTPDNARTALAALPRMVQLALGFASRLRRGTLDVTLPDGRVVRLRRRRAGPGRGDEAATITASPRGCCNGGDIGIAEAYLRGEWDTPDLTQFLYLFCVNHD